MNRHDRRRERAEERAARKAAQNAAALEATTDLLKHAQELRDGGLSENQVLATIANELNRYNVECMRLIGAPVVANFIGFIGPDGQAHTACFAGADGHIQNANELIEGLCDDVRGSVERYKTMGRPTPPPGQSVQ